MSSLMKVEVGMAEAAPPADEVRKVSLTMETGKLAALAIRSTADRWRIRFRMALKTSSSLLSDPKRSPPPPVPEVKRLRTLAEDVGLGPITISGLRAEDEWGGRMTELGAPGTTAKRDVRSGEIDLFLMMLPCPAGGEAPLRLEAVSAPIERCRDCLAAAAADPPL